MQAFASSRDAEPGVTLAVDDGAWLDVLRWSCADGEERLILHAERFDAVRKMHELLEDATQVGRGELVAVAE